MAGLYRRLLKNKELMLYSLTMMKQMEDGRLRPPPAEELIDVTI
jgi:hypothetical protein